MRAIDDLRRALDASRVVAIDPDGRARIDEAIERARTLLASAGPPRLVVAITGGTGAGKSTLINALAGRSIAVAAATRPTTTSLHVYHHRDLPPDVIPPWLREEAAFTAHAEPSLANAVLIDTPDLDSFVTEHRRLTRALLKAAGLVLYVFTPDKYADERVWSVLREEKEFSSCAAVLNRIDEVAPGEVPSILADIRERFAGVGVNDVPVFATSARDHAPGGDGVHRRHDSFPALVAFLEHERRDGDLARQRRAQRERAVEAVRTAIAASVPRAIDTHLSRLDRATDERIDAAVGELDATIDERLSALTDALRPVAVLAGRASFWGPLRAWLAVGDFVRYGLPGMARRAVAGFRGTGTRAPIDLGATAATEISRRIARDLQALQDRLYEWGLPVARWQALAESIDAAPIADRVADEIASRFQLASARRPLAVRVVAWVLSAVAFVVSLVVSGAALWEIGRRLVRGEIAAFDVLLDAGALLVLAFVLLGALSMLVGARGPNVHRLRREVLRDVVGGRIASVVDTYRGELVRELERLEVPVDEMMALAHDGPGDGGPDRRDAVRSPSDDPRAGDAPESPTAPDGAPDPNDTDPGDGSPGPADDGRTDPPASAGEREAYAGSLAARMARAAERGRSGDSGR